MSNQKKERRSSAVAKLAECVVVKVDGKDIRVPVSAPENRALNCLLVSRARTVVEEQLRKYHDLEAPLTLRELKDLVESVARMAESSADVYSTLEGSIGDAPEEPSSDPVDRAKPVVEVDFEDLTRTKDKVNTLEENGNSASKGNP